MGRPKRILPKLPFRYTAWQRTNIALTLGSASAATKDAAILALEDAAMRAIAVAGVLARHETRDQAVAAVSDVLVRMEELRAALSKLGHISAAALFLEPDDATQRAGLLTADDQIATRPPWGWIGPAPGGAVAHAADVSRQWMSELQAVLDRRSLEVLSSLPDSDFRRSRSRPSELPKRMFAFWCLGCFQIGTGREARADDRFQRFVAAAIGPTGLHSIPVRGHDEPIRDPRPGERHVRTRKGHGVKQLVADAFKMQREMAAPVRRRRSPS